MMKKDVRRMMLVGLVLLLGALMAACQPSAPTAQPGGGAATEAPGAAATTATGGQATQATGGEATQAAGGAATQAAGGAATQAAGGGPTQTMEAVSKNVNLDPALATDPDSAKVNGFIYEPLVGIDKGQPVAWLAKSWTEAEDGLAYTFELRTDVKFSDGSPLNAAAVIADFNRWFDPSDPLHGSGTYTAWLNLFGGFKGESSGGKPKSAVDGVEKAGEFTVVLHLNRPVDKVLQTLSSVPFSIVKMSADGKTILGTGAYMLGERNDQHILLVANPNYSGPYPASGNLEFPLK